MLEGLDSIGIRDPLWGTLGWLALIFGAWFAFWALWLFFYVNAPGWPDKEWRWHRD